MVYLLEINPLSLIDEEVTFATLHRHEVTASIDQAFSYGCNISLFEEVSYHTTTPVYLMSAARNADFSGQSGGSGREVITLNNYYAQVSFG